MNTAIISCALIAFVGAVIKLIIDSSGREQVSKAISNVIGIILLVTFAQIVFSKDAPVLSFKQDATNYDEARDSFIASAIEGAETEIEKQICDELTRNFNISPKKCEIEINNETLDIISAEIAFDRDEFLISTYEVRNYIKIKFEINAEVFFI